MKLKPLKKTPIASAPANVCSPPAAPSGAPIALSVSKQLTVFDVPLNLLITSPENPNEQDDSTFDLLVASVKENGIDEPVIVVPHPDGLRYFIASGEHRYKACKFLEYSHVPCVIKTNWTDDQRKFALVQRNMLKGNLNPEKFTELYNELAKKYDKSILQAYMGFTKTDAFDKLYKAIGASLPAREKKRLDDAKETVRSVDDLSSILNTIFKEGGSNLDNGYLVFSFGGKRHHYVTIDDGIDKMITRFEEAAKNRGQSVTEAFRALLKNADLSPPKTAS